MSSTITRAKTLSLAKITKDYSMEYRRVAVSLVGLLLAETLWFAYAGFRLRFINAGGAGHFGVLSKCTGNVCLGPIGVPPFYISPITDLLTFVLPAIWALVFVAPSFARELESKSVRFTWTQGIRRNQWLGSRLLPGLIGAFLITAVEDVETNRWIYPHTIGIFGPWQMFEFRDASIVGIAVLLVTVSVFFSILIRRTLLVVLLTAVAYLILLFGVAVTEPILLTPKSATVLAGYKPVVMLSLGLTQYSGEPIPPEAQFVSETILTKRGTPVSNAYMLKVYQTCSSRAYPETPGQQKPNDAIILGQGPNFIRYQQLDDQCLSSYHFYNKFSYQPSYRFWELQWIYAAITGALALFVLAMSFSFLRRVEP